MRFRYVISYLSPLVAVLLLGGSGLWMATDGLNALTDEGARRYQVERTKPQMPSFMVEDMQSKILTIGGSTAPNNPIIIVEFIYTSCPTICQSAGAYYAQLRDKLEAKGLGEQDVRLLSVSFDPENDSLEDLADYGEYHNADGKIWTVARINLQDLEQLKKSFGIIIINDEFGGYQHNAAMHVLSASGQLIAIHDLEDIDGVLEQVIN